MNEWTTKKTVVKETYRKHFDLSWWSIKNWSRMLSMCKRIFADILLSDSYFLCFVSFLLSLFFCLIRFLLVDSYGRTVCFIFSPIARRFPLGWCCICLLPVFDFWCGLCSSNESTMPEIHRPQKNQPKRIVCTNSFVYFRRNKNGPLEYLSSLFDFQSFQIYIFLVFYVVASVCRWTDELFNTFFIFRCCLFCTCKI